MDELCAKPDDTCYPSMIWQCSTKCLDLSVFSSAPKMLTGVEHRRMWRKVYDSQDSLVFGPQAPHFGPSYLRFNSQRTGETASRLAPTLCWPKDMSTGEQTKRFSLWMQNQSSGPRTPHIWIPPPCSLWVWNSVVSFSLLFVSIHTPFCYCHCVTLVFSSPPQAFGRCLLRVLCAQQDSLLLTVLLSCIVYPANSVSVIKLLFSFSGN